MIESNTNKARQDGISQYSGGVISAVVRCFRPPGLLGFPTLK